MLSEIALFVNWVHRRRSPNARTWKDYSYDLHQFASFTGDCSPNKITFRDVDRFVNQQVSMGLQPSTINRRLTCIISFYTFLSDEDPTLVCPVLPHRHNLFERDHLPRPVQLEQLRSFFSVIDHAVTDGSPEAIRDYAMFTLMLRCGLCIGEVANLLLADLFLDEIHPRLVARGKGSRERSVYLSPQAEHSLRSYLLLRPSSKSDFVFLSYQKEGMSTTAIHKRLMRYRSASQTCLTAHRLRHSFANDLISANVPVTSIQKLMGHRWLETTQIYVQANDLQVADDYYAACRKLEGWSSPEDRI